MERSQSLSNFNAIYFKNDNNNNINNNNNNLTNSFNFNNNNNSKLLMQPQKAIGFRQTHLQQQLQHSGSSDNITKHNQMTTAQILHRFQKQHQAQKLQQSKLPHQPHHIQQLQQLQLQQQQLQQPLLHQQLFHKPLHHHKKRILTHQMSTDLSDDLAYAADHEDEEEEEEEYVGYDDINDRTLTPMDEMNQIYSPTTTTTTNTAGTLSIAPYTNTCANTHTQTHTHTHTHAATLPLRKQLRFKEHKQHSESALLCRMEPQHHPPPLTRNCSATTTISTSSASSVHGYLRHGDSMDSTAEMSPLSRRHPFGILKRDNSIHSDSSRYSSVDSLLEARKPDPEAILINLGFGPVGSEDILTRLPKRFLKPSQVRGIDTDAFVKRLQLANSLADHSALGYRGLTGNPDIPPSTIVAKIMKRFEVNERKKSMGSIEHMI